MSFDIAEYARETAELHARLVKVGIKVERDKLLPLLRAIVVGYEKALGDPKAVIPSPLMAAIVVAQQEVRELDLEAANNYANDMIKRDKEVPQWEREARTGARDVLGGV